MNQIYIYNISLKIKRRILYNLYKDLTTTIKANDKTEKDRIRKGVRQEYLLSPTLFNIYI